MTTDKKIGLEHDKLTPITKQPILEVRADKWHDMPVADLWEQRSILQSRLVASAAVGNQSLIFQMQRGIAALDEVIAQRSSESELKLL